MCTDVGVVKRIEVEKISKDIAELVKILEKEVHGDTVTVPAGRIRKTTKAIDQVLAENASKK